MGAFLAVLISRSLLHAGPAQLLSSAAPVAQQEVSALGTCDQVRTGLARFTPEAMRISSDIAALQALRAQVEGEPLPWPEDADPVEMSRALVELGDELVHEGMELETVDCSEYPCIGVYGIWTPETPPQVTEGQYSKRAFEALRSRPELDYLHFGRYTWREGDTHYVAIYPYTKAPDPVESLRVDMRTRLHEIRVRP